MVKQNIIEVMTKKSKSIANPMSAAIAAWDESKTVADFFKRKMAQNGNADRVVDNIISKSLIEEKPEWTRLLIDSMKTVEDKQPVLSTQINFFQTASEQINESVKRLIDVSPRRNKKGIEAII